MYLSRPPISPGMTEQLTTNKTQSGGASIHRGKGNVTTVMVKDPDEVRHPTTQRWQKKWQNEQSSDTPVNAELTVDAGQ